MYSDVYGNGFRRIIQKPILGGCLNKILRDKNMISKDGKRKYERGLREGRAEGRECGLREGIDRINQLNVKLSELHRTEDILKATTDKEYQKKLFEEFGL